MAGFIMHKDALVVCDHSPGIANADSPEPRVKVSGMPVMTVLRTYTITGCGLQSSSTSFCATGAWTKGAQRVFAGGLPVAIDNGQSLCATTFGKLNARVVQQRVQAS